MIMNSLLIIAIIIWTIGLICESVIIFFVGCCLITGILCGIILIDIFAENKVIYNLRLQFFKYVETPLSLDEFCQGVRPGHSSERGQK